MTTKEEKLERIQDALTSLRPFLEADGGDIQLVDLTDDNVVKVKLLGACSDCSMSAMTLKAGVEQAIMKVLPEITKVIAINSEELA